MNQNIDLKFGLIGIFTGFLIATIINVVDAGNTNVGTIELNISPVKDVYYVGDEITINFVLTPNENGCFATLIFTRINGSVETLFRHETGCKSCGLAKPPLRSKTTIQKKKKFNEPGIYEIEGMIKDAETYESEFKKIKLIVKGKVVKNAINNEVVKDRIANSSNKINKNTNKNITDTDENSQIPVVIEVFTHHGCPICEHVDEAVKKLADEYNKRSKNSIILLEYHLYDTFANQVGLDRRIFYGGKEWENTCNYYALTLFNGENEVCGGTHNTESDYRNFKNIVENKNLIPNVYMRANASYSNTSLYVDVKIKAIKNEKNLDVFIFIADGTNVKAYIQKPVRIDKNNKADVKFSFPYSEISTYKNLRVVAVVQEGKKILNARLIERSDIQKIKKPKGTTKNISTTNNLNQTNQTPTNQTNQINQINQTPTNQINQTLTNKTTTNISNVTITNSINFMYCVESRDMFYCAIKLALLSFGIKI